MMKKVYVLFFLILGNSGLFGQTLYDSYTDGDYTASPVWAGTANWIIVANSDVAAGAIGSQTLRLNSPAVSATDYLSSQITTWGTSQEWGFFVGRRAQAATAANQAYFWLYANESNLTSATVDGYRIAYGDDAGGDNIRLEYIVNGALSATVITSSGTTTNAITDFGFLVRVTRSSAGNWEIFTSTLPTVSGTGAIATDIPNATNANISQGTATENTLIPAASGYVGVAALHSSGANAIIGVEFDQVYFTPTIAGTPNIIVSPVSLSGFIALSGVPSAEQNYSVSGTDLTADIVITPPVGFEIATVSGGPYTVNPAAINLTPTGGTVPATNIYVRMNSASLGVNTGNITHTSAGSNNPNVALSGKVLAPEPTVQSSITIGAITNSTVVVNFSGGNGARRILLAKLAVAVDSNPVDGTTYTANANFGNGTQIGTGNYVVYDGTGNTQLVTGLTAGATYHFAIYEYNNGGTPGAENYLVPGGVGNATLLTYSVPYVWIGLNGDWQVPANWAPARLFPATNDSLLFTSASVNDVITNVPTQTVGYIGASLLTGTTLQASAPGNTLTIGNLTGTDFFVEAGSSFNINTANALTLNLVTGATASISGNMTFENGAHKLTAVDASAVTFNSGAVFTAGTGFISNAFGVNPTATANSVIFAGGSTYRQISGSNPFALNQPLTVVIFQTGSLFKLESNLTPSVSGRTYANFELDAPASLISASGTGLLRMDNVTITNGNITFGMTTAGFELRGNVSVAAGGILNFAPASAGMLSFNGSSAQSISNAGTLTFGANQNVTINNAAGLTLNSPVTLLGTLTFTAGNINTTAVNLLTLGAASSVTGASNASFVFGPVKKIGNTDFIFPVGKVNGYVPIGVSNFTGLSAPTDEFTAEYIRASGNALGANATVPPVNRISACEYWTLDVNAGTPTVDLTLYWNANNPCNSSAYITNVAAIEVVHFNGTIWNTSSVGFSAKTGTTAAGNVTWTSVSTFSPFTLASSSNNNPLPITINYFNGTRSNGNHLLNWKVTCVSTPSATIDMERSTDGRNFSSIYSIFATALRCQQPFDHTDNQPAKGINYYRLKMTDADGKVTYSTTVTLINAVKGIEVMNIAPNPIVNGTFNLKISTAEKTTMELVITDMQGRVLQKRSAGLIAGFNQVPMHVRNLSAGTYQLFGHTADGRTRVLRFVVQ